MSHKYSHEEDLQKVGLESTPAREAIIHIIEEHKRPVDVATIIESLEKHNIPADKVTIYRILDLLVEKNVFSRVEFQEGKFRYELATSDHHHLICRKCGKVDDIEDRWIQLLEKDIKKKNGFMVEQHKLEFYGLCKECQKLQ